MCRVLGDKNASAGACLPSTHRAAFRGHAHDTQRPFDAHDGGPTTRPSSLVDDGSDDVMARDWWGSNLGVIDGEDWTPLADSRARVVALRPPAEGWASAHSSAASLGTHRAAIAGQDAALVGSGWTAGASQGTAAQRSVGAARAVHSTRAATSLAAALGARESSGVRGVVSARPSECVECGFSIADAWRDVPGAVRTSCARCGARVWLDTTHVHGRRPLTNGRVDEPAWGRFVVFAETGAGSNGLVVAAAGEHDEQVSSSVPVWRVDRQSASVLRYLAIHALDAQCEHDVADFVVCWCAYQERGAAVRSRSDRVPVAPRPAAVAGVADAVSARQDGPRQHSPSIPMVGATSRVGDRVPVAPRSASGAGVAGAVSARHDGPRQHSPSIPMVGVT